MAMTKAETIEMLNKLAHPLFTDTAPGRAIISGLALVISTGAAAFDGAAGWLDQAFRQRSDEEHTEYHGQMNAKEREPTEGLESFRNRANMESQAYTHDSAKRDQDSAVSAQGDGYSVQISEPYLCALDMYFFLDTPYSMPIPEQPEANLACFHMPMPEEVNPDAGAHLGVGAYLDSMAFLGENIHGLDRPWLLRALNNAEDARCLGVGYVAMVDDYWQEAYWTLLI